MARSDKHLTAANGERPLKVGVVGPSAAGKSTLVTALREVGYNARHIAQEHSYVADMWRRISNPDVLIYLHVSYEVSRARRPGVEWGPDRHAAESDRLGHAREHADLTIDTDPLTAAEVRERVFAFLRDWQAR